MISTIVNVSYHQGHKKGADWSDPINAIDHASQLELACNHLLLETGCPVIVSATAFAGILDVPAGEERDAIWRVFARCRLVSSPHDPGHQVGAALAIRLGLEFAAKTGIDYLIHTAEDILPNAGVLESMHDLLCQGYAYVGEKWGERGDQLNSQFFACRVQELVGPFNPCAVTGAGCIELYMARLMEGKRVCRIEGGTYRHTHDGHEYRNWLKEMAK